MANEQYADRSQYPLNVNSFVPFALSQQQQMYMRQQQQQQHDQTRGNKMRLSQITSGREAQYNQSDYASNNEEDEVGDALFSSIYFNT